MIGSSPLAHASPGDSDSGINSQNHLVIYERGLKARVIATLFTPSPWLQLA